MAEEQPATNAADTNLTLSAALLAPLNAIFEAQVHAARAFLNFVLQMGFKHRYDRRDLARLQAKETLTEDEQYLRNQIEEMVNRRDRYDELVKKSSEDSLSPDEQEEMERLREQLLDDKRKELYEQEFTYADGSGNLQTIRVSNLALIPVKPLAVESANFKFSMAVEQTYDYRQMRSSIEADQDRPWFLIKPKGISGKIAPGGATSNQAAIEIEIKVGTTETPQGLTTLLTSLTQSARLEEPEV